MRNNQYYKSTRSARDVSDYVNEGLFNSISYIDTYKGNIRVPKKNKNKTEDPPKKLKVLIRKQP